MANGKDWQGERIGKEKSLARGKDWQGERTDKETRWARRRTGK